MQYSQTFNLKLIRLSVIMAMLSLSAAPAIAAPLALANTPLFLTNNGKPNVLMMMGNANSMDEDATGGAVGSAAATSKSEISRNAMKNIITNNMNALNLGLLAYQQNAASRDYLNASQYDASYDPADYNPTYTGPRNGKTKKFRIPNPTSAGNYIYYNVALPFYSTSNVGNSFCYSSTACTSPTRDFFGTAQSGCTTAENPVGNAGPWDTYSCWGIKTGTSNEVPASTAQATAAGYSSSQGSGAFSPTTSDLGQGITDFGQLLPSQYVSRTWYNNTAPGMGFLHTKLALLDSTQAAKLNLKLVTSNPATDTNSPTDPAKPLQNSGLAPLEGTLITANNYFNDLGLPATQRAETYTSPPNSCGHNYLVLLTDGLPSVSQAGVPSANVATLLANATTQTNNLRTSAAAVKTYMVGFALPYGVNPAQLDTIAAAGGTGTAYNANDPVSLNAAFSTIFSNIAADAGASSSVAVNSGSLSTGSRIYQAKFNAVDWSGQLLSYDLNTLGVIGSNAVWDSGMLLKSPSATSRNIITYKPSTKAGIAFRWPSTPTAPTSTELDTSQSTALNTSYTTVVDGNGSQRLAYLRGSAINEGTGLNFRPRNTSKLGDIVDSAPIYVGAPSANPTDTTYAAFRSANTARTPIIYVGANDGMLHGFKTSDGSEAIAYIPSAVYSNLSVLTSTTYTHRYYVNGSPNSADVYYSGAWHTALVSGMGAGAKGIFGLDVTDPSIFSEANAASIVNFEFPNATTVANDIANSTTDVADVGFVSGKIPIVKLNNGEWAAVFGNGYNSTGTGQSSIFIVNIKTGALIKKIATGVGTTATPNAMANPLTIDTDGNGTADAVYAGDLQGNMWKFDISGAAPGSWGLAYKLYAAGSPITETPEATKNPSGDYLIYFGTGKYLETADITSATTNTFYGIWDHFNGTVSSGLVQQTIATSTVNGNIYRTLSNNNVAYTGASPNKGWYVQLPESGERSVTDPIVRGGRVIFTTLTPNTSSCGDGGTSWLMELDYLKGGALSAPPFDTNNDNSINAMDAIVGGLSSNKISSAPSIVGGSPEPLPGGSSPVRNKDYKYINQSDGTVKKVTESASGAASRRTSWRQLQIK
jgi:type IV pilus assembly protein PilY1